MNKKLKDILLMQIAHPWKWLADLWGYLTLIIFLVDFTFQDHYRVQSTGIAIIYIAILIIYTSNKEYLRWKSKSFYSRYHGEMFIALWTLLLFLFVTMVALIPERLTVEPVFYTTYISVLGIFAVTLNSKKMKIKYKKISKPLSK